VNDTYGHLVGDRVLKTIAQALTASPVTTTGPAGSAARSSSPPGPDRRPGRLQDRRAPPRLHRGPEDPDDDRPDAPTLQVTISIGVTAPGRGESYELTDLLAASDSAMYAAKQAGRNQVAFARPLRDNGPRRSVELHPGRQLRPSGTHPSAPSPQAPPGRLPVSSHRVVLVQAEQTAVSLCPQSKSPCFVKALYEAENAPQFAYHFAMRKCTCSAANDGRTLAGLNDNIVNCNALPPMCDMPSM